MRELKFRAYDTKLKQWVVEGFHVFCEVTLFNLIGQHCYETRGEGDSLQRYNDIVVTQWTGLKDKNGKDIYEGDILKENEGIFEVVWDIKYAKFKLDWTRVCGHIQFPEWNRGVNMIVIGNIYENPELLKS